MNVSLKSLSFLIRLVEGSRAKKQEGTSLTLLVRWRRISRLASRSCHLVTLEVPLDQHAVSFTCHSQEGPACRSMAGRQQDGANGAEGGGQDDGIIEFECPSRRSLDSDSRGMSTQSDLLWHHIYNQRYHCGTRILDKNSLILREISFHKAIFIYK